MSHNWFAALRWLEVRTAQFSGKQDLMPENNSTKFQLYQNSGYSQVYFSSIIVLILL
jgi:hypothetical protein